MSENEHAEIDEENAGADDPEAIDGSGDETGASLPENDELAAALQEAAQAVDQREAGRAAAEKYKIKGRGDSADKMTIEMLSHELQSLKNEHESALASHAESEDKHLRLQAEFENFRRRTLKEKQDTFKYGHQNLVKDLLASVDNLERALVHGEGNQDGDFQSLLQGVELVQRELLGALAKHGVERIDAEGTIFDPAVHEAMAQIPADDVPANSVMQVLQVGYMLRDRMLRPARVVVSKAVEPAVEPAAEPAAERTFEEQDESEQKPDDAPSDREQ